MNRKNRVSIQECFYRGLSVEDIDVSTVSTHLFSEGEVTSIKDGGINATGFSVVVEGIHEGEYYRETEYTFNVWCEV